MYLVPLLYLCHFPSQLYIKSTSGIVWVETKPYCNVLMLMKVGFKCMIDTRCLSYQSYNSCIIRQWLYIEWTCNDNGFNLYYMKHWHIMKHVFKFFCRLVLDILEFMVVYQMRHSYLVYDHLYQLVVNSCFICVFICVSSVNNHVWELYNQYLVILRPW